MIKKKELDVNVLEASKSRLEKLFGTNNKFVLSFSGGKDSIVLADIIYNLILAGKINSKQLEVIFIDEEAMYDEVIAIVEKWRKKFMQAGVKFTWYCMQVKHFNCLNTLNDEETFICWDERQKENWVRQPPKFAVRDDKYLVIGKDNYQSWSNKYYQANGKIVLIGIRSAESVQRMQYLAEMKSVISDYKVFPIYDWSDKDIWLYIYKYNLEIPNVYENMYRIGIPTSRLRISQFFSIDTAKSLVSMNEMYPDLMAKVIKREPNAYLCAMYWDTEMFGKRTAKRRKLEDKNEAKKDYKKLVFEMLSKPKNLDTNDKKELAKRFKMQIVRFGYAISQKLYKEIYECLLTGDPKRRKYRSIFLKLQIDRVNGEKNA